MSTNLINKRAEFETLCHGFQGSARDVVANLGATDFTEDKYITTYKALKQCVDADVEVSPVSVANMLKRMSDEQNDLFGLVGGITGLEKLADAKVYNLDNAIEAVREFGRRRRLRDDLEKALEMLNLGQTDSEGMTSVLFNAAMDISGATGDESVAVESFLDDWWQDIENIQKGVVMGYTTGIPTIDEAICGARPGEMVCITGAPGRGKSLYLLKILIINALLAETKVPTALYSLEMGKKQVMNRAAVMLSDKINLRQLRGGPSIPIMSREQMKELAAIRKRLAEAKLYIGDKLDNIDKVLADATRRVKRDGVKIIAIDYAQLLIEGTGMNEASELAKISRKCRMFSQKENVCVILLLKMKQTASTDALKGNTPTGDMVYGSGAFYYDANVLLWIHVDDDQYVCGCDKQAIIDRKTKEVRSRHAKEDEGLECPECNKVVTKDDKRLGRIVALKVRDGEAGAEAQVVMRGARMQLEEVGRIVPEIVETRGGDGKRRFKEELISPAEEADDIEFELRKTA